MRLAPGPGSAAELVHRVPRTPVVDRREILLQLARGRRVAHLGFVDYGLLERKRRERTWLHDELAQVAREIVGIDLDPRGVSEAASLGFEAYAADCQSEASLAALSLEPAELVIAGELIEHLDRPGAFLDAVKVLLDDSGALVMTTPNATALVNFLGALLGREIVSPDHVDWYSWRTLTTLLSRHGWVLEHFDYYANAPLYVSADRSFADKVKLRAANGSRRMSRPVFRVWPALADGMVAMARREPGAR